ncbi:MAG TPA: DUF4431 domain-containing protein [Myxococcales bacterium]|nr:DUF4431 domain-containing protein [Myxococcales bacterium]HIL99567.1 DUF4431 domain-containing protein [Myxococcales bacterium]
MKHLLLVVVLLGLTPTLASARCLKFEPVSVLLKGVFVSKSLPGPPGYLSIAKGDFAERVLFLQLDEPICVKGNHESTFNSRTQTGVKELQLVVPLGQSMKLIDQRVRVTGTLFSAVMKGHRTKVLMTVKALTEDLTKQ